LQDPQKLTKIRDFLFENMPSGNPDVGGVFKTPGNVCLKWLQQLEEDEVFEEQTFDELLTADATNWQKKSCSKNNKSRHLLCG
jgi:hypothetical protein